MNYPWGHSRRFNALSNFYLKKFGSRVQKLSVNAGFSCPNRDGSKGVSGCIYCNNFAFNPTYCHPGKSIHQQIEEGIAFHAIRYRKATKYFVYFQPFSNTYAGVAEMEEKFNQALKHPLVEGLVIGTRPDCIDDDKLDLLETLNRNSFISVEYGIESCYNRTLKRIHRGHDFEESVAAIKATSNKGIHVGGHIIFGLPGESLDEMIAEAGIISTLPLSSIKFHQLQIIKDTELANQYAENPKMIKIFNLDEYIDFIIDFTERLNPEIKIERFTAEVPPRFLVKGGFGLLRTDQILQKIEKRMEERDTWQGRLF